MVFPNPRGVVVWQRELWHSLPALWGPRPQAGLLRCLPSLVNDFFGRLVLASGSSVALAAWPGFVGLLGGVIGRSVSLATRGLTRLPNSDPTHDEQVFFSMFF